MIVVRSRRELLKDLIIAVCAVAIGVVLRCDPLKNAFISEASERRIVVVDAGHGLPDGGAVGINGTVEQEINLAVAKKVCEVLEGKGIKVIMTRSSDNCLCEETEGKSIRKMKVEDMNKRLDIIKKSNADLFISIHMNCFEKESAHGLRIFYDSTHPETKELAEKMQQGMAKVTGAKTYAVKSAEKSLFLMKNPPVPSILAECGFISNAEEEKKLNDEDYRSRLAWAIANAAEEFCSDDKGKSI